MGTSGSYGGSGSKPWQTARTAFDAAVTAPAAPAAAPTAAGAAARVAPGDPVAALAGAIASALWAEDIGVRNPRPLPLASILPGPRGGGGGGGGGGAGGGSTGRSWGGGRVGEGSRRDIRRGVQRGAAAIAAGYAVRTGDRAALAQLNLDLDALGAMSTFRQCEAILEAVLGEATHPDDAVLRRASAEQVKAVLTNNTEPNALHVIQDFVARFVVETGLIEIKAQMRVGLPDAEVVAKERTLRNYVRIRVRSFRNRLTDSGQGLVRTLQETAAQVAREALQILRVEAPR
jgi:hypothetical protein